MMRWIRNDGMKKKLKGVVAQQNGRWGAQRIWLGTFKSEREAAMAYDSAAMKLRGGGGQEEEEEEEQEGVFQRHHTTEAVVGMIRDGSYPSKQQLQLQLSPRSSRSCACAVEEDDEAVLLFKKELTPSDVGKLNRLVIPKKHALSCFPCRADEDKDKDIDHELLFYDNLMTPWHFRYCYWKSSQSYVFTRGWSRFVKHYNLCPKDTIAFYSCTQPQPFSFIHVIYATAHHHHHLPPKQDNNIITTEGPEAQDQHTIFMQDFNHAPKPTAFRLFGVSIHSSTSLIN